jgi:hypothetical protein
MMTTVVNPRKRRPAARRRTSRRRNDENPRRRRRRNDDNPRRRPRYARRRRNDGDNPRVRGYYRRRTRRNPEFAFDRFASATGGGALLRLLMKQIGGDRGADGKLTSMHYLTAAGTIYFAPDLAGIVTGDPRLQASCADGASAVAGQMLIDEHLDDFSGKYLMQFRPAAAPPAGLPPISGMGAREDYKALMGALGQAGQFVTQPDGSVVWYPSGMQGDGLGAGATMTIPETARIGAVLRDPATGQRFKLRRDASGEPALYPLAGDGIGDRGDYKRLAG